MRLSLSLCVAILVACGAEGALAEGGAGQPHDSAAHLARGRALLAEEARQARILGISELLIAAEAGRADAMFDLGWAHEEGRGVAQDFAGAALWYERAAAQGHGAAMNNLGWLHAQGAGVVKDLPRAVALYRAGAEAGEPGAMGNLGWMLEYGIGTAQDLDAAARWYRRAAEAGDTQAMLNLGNLYLTGNGVEADGATALAWFRKARGAGRIEALSYIGEVYEKAPEMRDPRRAAWVYVRALQAGDSWPGRRMAQEWDHETAMEVQRILRDQGHYEGPIDGTMGGGSRRAMQDLLAASAQARAGRR